MKVLFLDRDGTLIVQPEDYQVDSLRKVRLMPGVIPALLRLKAAGFRFILVSNQDGLGTDRFPEADFHVPHGFIRDLFSSQGVDWDEEFICPHFPEDGCSCRKPKTGLLVEYLRRVEIDRQHSFVVGDRDTDMELAQNLGLTGLRCRSDGSKDETWPAIAERILRREACIHRQTRETDIQVRVVLDRDGPHSIATGIGFLDHMLEQLACHGGFSLELTCLGDLRVDEHHTVEDCALALGEALARGLADKRGIARYGFLLPMDEALAEVALDLSGRPFFVFEGRFPRERIGELPTELVPHFFRSLTQAMGASLHLSVHGENTHHMVEACFKGVGRALRQATFHQGDALPSSKGVL